MENKAKTIHLSLDIEGFLNRASREPELAEKLFKDYSGEQAIKILEECLAIGRKVLPFSAECEGFDYRTGCPGHEVEEEATQ
jgi:hypothetical protein